MDKVLGFRQEGWSVNGPDLANAVVVVVVWVVEVNACTELRHPRLDMPALIHTGRRPIALSIQWWGFRAMSVHTRAGRLQGKTRQEEEDQQQQQLTYYVRMGALRFVACARRVTAARVEERLDTLLVAGTTALFSCLGGDCT
jgi:hypothetical protein